MSNNSKYLERGAGELILFAMAFIGVVTVLLGVVTGVVGVALTGFGLAFFAVTCFLIAGYLSED